MMKAFSLPLVQFRPFVEIMRDLFAVCRSFLSETARAVLRHLTVPSPTAVAPAATETAPAGARPKPRPDAGPTAKPTEDRRSSALAPRGRKKAAGPARNEGGGGDEDLGFDPDQSHDDFEAGGKAGAGGHGGGNADKTTTEGRRSEAGFCSSEGRASRP